MSVIAAKVYNDETQFIVDLTQDDSYCDIGTEKNFNEA